MASPEPWPLIRLVELSLVGKLTNAQRCLLVEKYATAEDALASLGILHFELYQVAEKIITKCQEANVRILSRWHPDFPSRLLVADPMPMLLYVAGNLPPSSVPAIAVVGTRSCTASYGKPVTEKCVELWTKSGCVIVSGLANGIDTIAHEACLRSRGTTVAVIASGHQRISPQSAQHLSKQIVEHGGAVISEYPITVAALPPYFPARNRIISALSDAVVIVESKLTGGALITADFALRQGTPLWAVPGPITGTRSAGCNNLIKTGKAMLLDSAESVLNTLFAGTMHEQFATDKHCYDSIPTDLVKLFGADPIFTETAAQQWNCSIAEALVRLSELEMNGYIRQIPGGRWHLA
ncbi:MAG: DNA-protecting protein DprA [Chlorobi bacterium]|nr:MAG: DNA-protecting protein DprA [Bacteroidota bacterium]KXK33870.1 MAG: DNA protecting protein DprA [Chlorobi bacterium OLB6]MBL1161477.1 DNA-protecting protein DprA [Chlorobiota bacterium]MBV6463407.1 hypothetical protein [Chlorobiota bacterium]NOG67943.1 DNA-protecting protein DprA [Chlorobiota bacterium]